MFDAPNVFGARVRVLEKRTTLTEAYPELEQLSCFPPHPCEELQPRVGSKSR